MLLHDRHRKIILSLAEELLPSGVELWAYGSRVTGDAHSGSDLDLVLRRCDLKPIPVQTVRQFREALRHSNLPMLTDLLDWDKIPSSFHKNILKNYVVLWRGN